MGKKYILIFWITVSTLLAVILLFKKLYSNFKKNSLEKYMNTITVDSINSLSGEEFEEFLYYLFLNMGFVVKRTKKSHDYGADLILIYNNISIAVQCKLYVNHAVGTSSVQEVFSSTKYYNTRAGVVITNSVFTRSAIALAKSTNVLLWDKTVLDKILKFKQSEKNTFRQQLLCNIIKEN